jgi:glycosyltransferase involved in cell wall biosynthesis
MVADWTKTPSGWRGLTIGKTLCAVACASLLTLPPDWWESGNLPAEHPRHPRSAPALWNGSLSGQHTSPLPDLIRSGIPGPPTLHCTVIRLVLLIPTLDRSGAEKQLALLACGLPRDQFHVEVIALTRGGPYADVLAGHDIPVTILHKRSRLDLAALRRLKQMLHSRQPDILHTWLFAANSYGRLAIDRRSPTKVVVSERCVDTWKAPWQLWFDRRLIGRTDRLVGNSQSVVDFYVEQGFPQERTTVIYNGIDVCEDVPREGGAPAEPRGRSNAQSSSGSAGASPSQSLRDRLIRQLDLPADARLVGFVGRLAKQKRIEDLLWAMQITRQANDQAYLLIIGDGPERSALEQHARDVEVEQHVRFLGHRDDAGELMRSLDVFWLASDFEGLSNSLMEAMAAGVPVVASNIAPNRELIAHGDEGYLVDVGDGLGFAQYTLKLLAGAELASSMGQQARSRIRDHFSVQKMIDAHVKLYREILV